MRRGSVLRRRRVGPTSRPDCAARSDPRPPERPADQSIAQGRPVSRRGLTTRPAASGSPLCDSHVQREQRPSRLLLSRNAVAARSSAQTIPSGAKGSRSRRRGTRLVWPEAIVRAGGAAATASHPSERLASLNLEASLPRGSRSATSGERNFRRNRSRCASSSTCPYRCGRVYVMACYRCVVVITADREPVREPIGVCLRCDAMACERGGELDKLYPRFICGMCEKDRLSSGSGGLPSPAPAQLRARRGNPRADREHLNVPLINNITTSARKGDSNGTRHLLRRRRHDR